MHLFHGSAFFPTPLLYESVNSCAARLPLRQRRRSRRLAEILRPTPIPNLRHVLKMLPDVRVMLVQFPVEHVDRIRRLRAQPRHMLQRINRQMEAAHLVEHHHIERRGRRALDR